MKRQPDLTAFKFACRGMLGGIIVPGVFGTILILWTMDERTFLPVPPIVAAYVIFGGAIGVVVGFIIGLLYSNGLHVGFFKRLSISSGLTAFASALLMITFGSHDWLRDAQIVGFLVLISGILPAVTTGRLYSGNEQSEVL
jgi:uncharacterized protein involved in response to NO